MPNVYTCPRGHRWDNADAPTVARPDALVLCPTCGQMGKPGVGDAAARSSANTDPFVTKPPPVVPELATELADA